MYEAFPVCSGTYDDPLVLCPKDASYAALSFGGVVEVTPVQAQDCTLLAQTQIVPRGA